jgi:hypothetical protein
MAEQCERKTALLEEVRVKKNGSVIAFRGDIDDPAKLAVLRQGSWKYIFGLPARRFWQLGAL